MDKEFLPIGTVVDLKESTASVMVAGYLPIASSDQSKVWDYSGFRFPLGYVHDDQIICFDQDQIETIYAYGYMDIEQQKFIAHVPEKKAEVIARMQEVN